MQFGHSDKNKILFQNLLRYKYSSDRNIYSLIINVTREEIKEKMFGYGSKYLNVNLKIRAYCLQICAANELHKSRVKNSKNISPKGIILVPNLNLRKEYRKNYVWLRLWPGIFQ